MDIKIQDIEQLEFIKAYNPRKIKVKSPIKNAFVLKYISDKIPKKAGIYFLYNKNRELLYIGESSNISQRIVVHRTGINPYYVKFIIISESKRYRIGIEQILIWEHNPILQRELNNANRY